ncbi:MAG: family N-acetyltransferase [Eubacterium sp.]|jgi:RimJ/RimL family protein N-acetyltransferase|nr:family N-acetyltransferase [Eubacterium sp.]
MKQIILKTGETLKIRKAKSEDAQNVLNFTNKACGETDFLTFGPGEFLLTVEQEQQFLESIDKLNNAVYLVGEIDGQIIGTASFVGGSRPRIAHTGEFGMCILKEHWGKGIGTELLKYLMDYTRSTGIIRKLNLRVRADNLPAIHLYKKLGFAECGRITREVNVKGKFHDSILMEYEIE